MNKEEFNEYKRTNIAEMRQVTMKEFRAGPDPLVAQGVSISAADLDNGSPKPLDMIARNPENHDDQWLVAYVYFRDNFEEA